MNAIGLAFILTIAVADPPGAVAEPLVRTARDDAQRRLAQCLTAIQIEPQRGLASILDPDADPIDALLPLARRARDAGPPIVYSDGAVELHQTLHPEDIREETRTLLVRRKESAVTIRSVLDTLTDSALADCTLTAGFGHPRRDSDSSAEARPAAAVADMTTAAAILDARRQMVDRIGQLRLRGRVRLEEQLLQTPGLEDELLKSIPISVFGPTRRKGPNTMEVSATLSAQHAVDLVGECMERLNPNAAAAMKLELESRADDVLSVRGVGVCPSNGTLVRMGLASSNPRDAAPAQPAWAAQCLTAEGFAAVAGGDERTSSAIATARDDAEFQARRRLAEKIDTLKLPDGRTVREVVLNRKVNAGDLLRFLEGAHCFGMADATPDGRVRVCVRLPLAGLWRLIAAAELQIAASAEDAP